MFAGKANSHPSLLRAKRGNLSVAHDLQIAALVNQFRGDTPVVLAMNKVDLVDAKKREAHLDLYGALVDNDAAILMSAIQGDGVSELVDYLREGMPKGPRYYPVDQVSEVNMRFIAAEVIREKIILKREHPTSHRNATDATTDHRGHDRDAQLADRPCRRVGARGAATARACDPPGRPLRVAP